MRSEIIMLSSAKRTTSGSAQYDCSANYSTVLLLTNVCVAPESNRQSSATSYTYILNYNNLLLTEESAAPVLTLALVNFVPSPSFPDALTNCTKLA